MKKSERIRFDEPMRQSYYAIIFFIYRFFKIVIRQIWPLLIAFLFGKEQFKTTLLLVVIGVSVLVLLFSVIAFFRYFFYIQNNELIVQKGIFQKSVTNIPFDRIQTINFEQSLLHQAFNVVKVEIDTAGSKGNELSFSALDKKVATKLRNYVLENRTQAAQTSSGEESTEVFPDKQETVMKLNVSELIKLGFGQNHMRSFLLIIAFSSWIFQQLNEIGVNTDEMMGNIDTEDLVVGKALITSFAILSILVTLAISLVRTFLKYYNFKLIRTNEGFKIESGLLNRRQVSARDHKIQIVSWADNPIKRLLGIFDVFLKQASSVQVQNRKSIVIPGCEKSNLEKIKAYYFKEEEWQNLNSFSIEKKYILRHFLYFGLVLFAAIFLILYFNFGLGPAFFSLAWLPISYLTALIRYRKWKIHINEHLLYIQHGLFGNYNKSLKLYKIQNISLEQSIYHRMNDLANIRIYTASGNIKIPFLKLQFAHQLFDYLSYKIEVDRRNWM